MSFVPCRPTRLLVVLAQSVRGTARLSVGLHVEALGIQFILSELTNAKSFSELVCNSSFERTILHPQRIEAGDRLIEMSVIDQPMPTNGVIPG